MPCGITAINKPIPKSVKWWGENANIQDEFTKGERPYYILRDDGKIIFEGYLSGVSKKLEISRQQAENIVKGNRKFPGGITWEKNYKSIRPMGLLDD